MALDLDNRPGQVYDPEDTGVGSAPSKSDVDKGISDLENYANSPSEDDIERGIGDLEKHANSSDGQGSAVGADESSMLAGADDTVGKGYKGKMGVKGSKKSSSRKKGIAAVASVSIAGVLVGVFMALPSFMINQIRDVMTGKIGDLQTRQSLKYRRAKLHKIGDIFSKDGRLGGGVIAEMEQRGYRFSFSPDEPNKIVGLTLPDGSKSLIGQGIGEHISDYMEVKHPLRTSRWKTKRMNALYSRFGISRVSIVKSLPDDLDSASDAINSRLAKTLDGDEIDLSAKVTGLADDASDEVVEAADELDNFAKNQNYFDILKEESKKTGKPLDQINSELALLARESTDAVDPYYHQLAESLAKSGSLAGKSFDTFKSLGATDIADKVCTIKGRLRAAVTAARAKRSVELMRYAAAFMGAADATRNGTANSGMMSALLKKTTALDRNGNSIGASPGFAYALKGKFSKSRNDATRTGVAVDGKLTGVIGEIQNTTDQIPATSKSQCNVWQNPITQIGAGVIEIGAAIFSGGSSAAVGTTAKQGVAVATKAAIKNVISKAVVKSLAKSIAFQVAIELSFEGIMTMTQIYAEKTLTYNFTGQEEGGELGDILTAGAGTLNKQRSLQSGMVPATTEQYAAAHNEYMTTIALERSNQSVFERYLNPYNVDSLAATALFQAPMTPEHGSKMLASGITNIFSAPQTIASGVTTAFMPQAFAQDGDEVAFDTYVTEGNNSGVELATDHAGNLQPIMLDSVEAIDPEENITVLTNLDLIDATTLEPKGEFQKHVENCVDAVDVISQIEATGLGDLKPENDCLAKLDTTIRFKAHLAFLDMTDGVQAEFNPETLSDTPATTTQQSSSGATTLAAPGLNGFAVPCTGNPTPVVRISTIGSEHSNWSALESSGVIGTDSSGNPINVYIREACNTSNPKTILIVSSVHGSENGGQFVGHELLYNRDLPDDIRIIVIPEINKTGIVDRDGGGVQRGGYFNTGRVNANGVNLNRNNDYRWSEMNGPENTSTTGTDAGNYRGPSPNSEPETQAVQNFIQSLGNISLSVHYHDNLFYVAPVGSTSAQLAQVYADASGMHGQCPDKNPSSTKCAIRTVNQRGSLDGWQAQTTGDPVLLVELSNDLSDGTIQKNVDGIMAIINGGLLQ